MTNKDDDTPIDMTIEKLDSLTEPVVLHHPPGLPRVIIAVVSCFAVLLLVLILSLAWAVTDNLNNVNVKTDNIAKEIQAQAIIQNCVNSAQDAVDKAVAAIVIAAQSQLGPEAVNETMNALTVTAQELPAQIEACKGR